MPFIRVVSNPLLSYFYNNYFFFFFLAQPQPNVVPTLATIAGNEVPIPNSRSSQFMNIGTRPPFSSFNAAAAATSSTMGNLFV